MNESKPLERITANPSIFGGKPIVRGRRLAVEHILGMLAAGDSPETILGGYPWLERDQRIVGIQRSVLQAFGHHRAGELTPLGNEPIPML
ncbi:MAG: DUF433 domain-containing protein [Chloroflexi bacterium]|nr:DUF433 domain-containing protein [Chloroflexota bacterium]